jgi:hypothetical protein
MGRHRRGPTEIVPEHLGFDALGASGRVARSSNEEVAITGIARAA